MVQEHGLKREKNLSVQLKPARYVPFIEETVLDFSSVISPERQAGKSSHKGGRFCREHQTEQNGG